MKNLILALVICGSVGGYFVLEKKKEKSEIWDEKFLTELASEQNKNYPVTIDQFTRLDNVGAAGNTFIYNYTWTNLPSYEIDKEYVKNDFFVNLKKTVCSTPDPLKFLDHGVTLSFRYKGNDAIFIDSLELTRADCI